jgi:AcrR family transcriptional regulator
MTKRDSYHHGDLQAALLAAAEAVLAETGLEGFSLRKVAARVGVSHSAPAHHYGDARGLLVALATRGFERLLAAMQARQAQAPTDPVAQLLASGEGYVDFALASPALFRLVFGSGLTVDGSPALEAAADAALGHLAADLARLRGAEPFGYPEAWDEVLAIWSLTHGFAELLISGRLKPVQDLGPDERAAQFRRLIAQKLRLAEHLRA